MTGLLLSILAAGIVAVSFSKIEKSIFCAVATTLLVVSFYPSFTVGALNTALSLAGLVVLLTISTLRAITSRLKPKFSPGVFCFIFFVIITSIANSVGGDQDRVSIMLVQGLMIILLSVTSSYFQPSYRNQLILLFALVMVVQFIVTTGEQFFGTGALWPRVNGTDIIENRPNSFTDILVGRSLGTMSMMITLGAFCGFAILLFSQRFLDSNRKMKFFWFSLIIVSGVVIFFSGTRSAVVALIIAALAWLITGLRSLAAQLLLLVGGSVVMIVILQIDIVALLGFSNFENTESFEHRFGVITSVTTILNNPTGLLFGRGGVGATDLLVNSLGGTDGLTSYDNMYVRELAVSGLLGFSLLVSFLVRSFFSGDKLSKILMIYLCAMGMSFDQFTWRVIFVLFALTVAGVFRETAEEDSDVTQDEEPIKSNDEQLVLLPNTNIGVDSVIDYENNKFVKKKLFL